MELEALTRTAAAEVAAALAERDQAWRDLAEALARATTAEIGAAVLGG